MLNLNNKKVLLGEQDYDWDKIYLAKKNRDAKAELLRYEANQPDSINRDRCITVLVVFFISIILLAVIDIYRHNQLMKYCTDNGWVESCNEEFTDPFYKQFPKVFVFIASSVKNLFW